MSGPEIWWDKLRPVKEIAEGVGISGSFFYFYMLTNDLTLNNIKAFI